MNKNGVSYAVWICLFMFCEGGHFVLAPNILKQIFGSKATQLYGILFSYTAVCSITQIILQDLFLGDSVKSYNRFFIMNGFLSGIALFLLMVFFTQEKYVPKKIQLQVTKF